VIADVVCGRGLTACTYPWRTIRLTGRCSSTYSITILDPLALLQDACRVSRDFVLIKDYLADSVFSRGMLRLMDWVGNRPHAVVLPYAYLSSCEWKVLYGQLGLTPERVEGDLGLYPLPFSILCGRNLHFIALLMRQSYLRR
jgi:hypothetical protein